ncbi:EAL domain-containing protein [Candidatus Reidiella endopervernicosa]|uniref:EAL domain-containing protein n=1 Tax=Candidatus Reidiella endopervernicosa TaxID=2738883 RepID=UPI002351B04B|nr:EAL domain-containing protein [Candidatus Reidiella endopervernicosa]
MPKTCFRKNSDSPSMAAVLFIDIDQFKVINDSLGHSVGDHMLKIFGDRLKTFAREGDTVARYGGDEFVMVFADVGSVDDIPPIANRLLVDVAQSIDYKDINLHITVSAGISIFPRDGSNSETLLKNADAAMYRAKELERNNFQFFTEELNTRVMERVTLESELRRAIENDELLLHYQPQVNLVSGKITGFEALLRWENPKHGLIPPNRFIPLAEDTGLIIPIGDWVLQTACAQAVAWREMGLPPVVMSINVSMHQLRSLEFNHTIAAALKRHQLPAEQLEIEVTESALMDDPEGVRKLLEKVRDMGVMIALDDLGTGYSSLSQLKHFPFGRLKIDQSFVAELVHETESAAIVRTIIAMSQGLGLNVIAEGVETESQLSILRRNGCYDIQGYYFSRSVESAQAQEMLQNGNVIDIPNDEGARTPTLLLVDDEPNILRALKRTLRDEGYHILAAESADEAFELLAQNEVDVIVSDQRMPKMNGVELLNIVKELYPDAVRMILSGYTDLDTVTEAVNRGWIYRFLAKPWDDQQLRGHIRDAFSSHMQ